MSEPTFAPYQKPPYGVLIYNGQCGVLGDLRTLRSALPKESGDRVRALSILITKSEEMLALIRYYGIDAATEQEEPK